MPIYEIAQTAIIPAKETSFAANGVRERQDLQRLLRENIEVISSGMIVISEEFGAWEDSRRRIDLLCIDKFANLVVVELKRTEDGGHMELQSIRYAAIVSKMTFDQAVNTYGRYLQSIGRTDIDPRISILSFLEWDDPIEGQFAQDVRIILVSAEFGIELTSSVLWLRERDIDIRCVRLKPYQLGNKLLVDVQQIIPLPEAAEYQVKVREKDREERQARASGADFTRFDIEIQGEKYDSLWKRNAIFLIVKQLCDNGKDPDTIASYFTWRSNRTWYCCPGKLGSAEFISSSSAQAAATGHVFDSRRWFLDDGDLVHFNNRTYAFSNQWGGENWHRAMLLLKENFPEFEIKFSPVTSS